MVIELSKPLTILEQLSIMSLVIVVGKSPAPTISLLALVKAL